MTMKRFFAVLFAAVIAVAAAACGGAGEPAVPAYGETPEAGPDMDAAEPYETGPDESGAGMETGIIVYYDGATLIICSLGGRNLSFLVEDGEVDKDETRGLAQGSEVDVYYTGSINGGDTSSAQVIKLAQSQSQAEVRDDVGVIGGVILESDGVSLRISAFDGDERVFQISGEDVDKSGVKGLETGDYVTVFYKGGAAGTEAGDVAVVKLVQ